MLTPAHPAIRALLRGHDDGFTINEIAARTDFKPESVRKALKAMPDVYIDRWQSAVHREPPQAVWCVVVPPEDCPRPDHKQPKRRDYT